MCLVRLETLAPWSGGVGRSNEKMLVELTWDNSMPLIMPTAALDDRQQGRRPRAL